MRVIGIDPGESTGFASYEDGKLTNLWTFKPLQAILFLSNADHNDGTLYVLEDSRMSSANYHDTTQTKAVIFTMGRRVGTVDRLCALYQEALGKNEMLRLSPLQKGSKWDHDALKAAAGWDKGQTNEHVRDAALVAWPYRRWIKA